MDIIGKFLNLNVLRGGWRLATGGWLFGVQGYWEVFEFEWIKTRLAVGFSCKWFNFDFIPQIIFERLPLSLKGGRGIAVKLRIVFSYKLT